MMWLINILALLLIGLIVWWFWLSRPRAQQASQDQIEIIVDQGVYTPAVIQVAAGQTVTLVFKRLDASPCAEQVQIDELDATYELPLNKPFKVKLENLPGGEYHFHCQMNMYQGTLVVK